jgi:prepilin-type N-terminal cleavage/methylation domain-containing protein
MGNKNRVIMKLIKEKNKKLGFTLIEMSIVLLIISTLIIVIAGSSQILATVRISNARSLTKASPVSGMSNLVIWYESTMEDSFLEDDVTSERISVWNNLSPLEQNIHRATQETFDNQPNYTTNTINNLPAVSFGKDFLLDPGKFLTFDGNFLANSDYTVAVVERRRRRSVSNYFIAGSSGDANQNLSLGYKNDTEVHFSQQSNNYIVPVPDFSETSLIPRIHIFRFSSVLGKNYYFYQNGGNLNGDNPKTLIIDEAASETQGLTAAAGQTIGQYLGGAAYYQGDIGEIIIFNKYINDNDRENVELYLSKKWGIDLN